MCVYLPAAIEPPEPLAYARDGGGAGTDPKNARGRAVAFDAVFGRRVLRSKVSEQFPGIADPGERIARYEIGGAAGIACAGSGHRRGASRFDCAHRG